MNNALQTTTDCEIPASNLELGFDHSPTLNSRSTSKAVAAVATTIVMTGGPALGMQSDAMFDDYLSRQNNDELRTSIEIANQELPRKYIQKIVLRKISGVLLNFSGRFANVLIDKYEYLLPATVLNSSNIEAEGQPFEITEAKYILLDGTRTTLQTYCASCSPENIKKVRLEFDDKHNDYLKILLEE